MTDEYDGPDITALSKFLFEEMPNVILGLDNAISQLVYEALPEPGEGDDAELAVRREVVRQAAASLGYYIIATSSYMKSKTIESSFLDALEDSEHKKDAVRQHKVLKTSLRKLSGIIAKRFKEERQGE